MRTEKKKIMPNVEFVKWEQKKKRFLMATFGNANRKKVLSNGNFWEWEQKKGITTVEKKKILSNGYFWEWEQKKGISTGEKKGISNVKILTNKKQYC